MMTNESWVSEKYWRSWMWVAGLAMVVVCLGADVANAATAREIDVSVDVALENFEKDVAGVQAVSGQCQGSVGVPEGHQGRGRIRRRIW